MDYFGCRLIARGIGRDWINPVFEHLSSLGVAALPFADAELMGGGGFLAAFSSGLAFGNSSGGICTCLYEFGEAEGQPLTLLVFMPFGAILLL